MITPSLRLRSEGLAEALPALLAQAQHLAATILLGDHGRRQAGPGDAFWQFRTAAMGDSLRQIDWRRSARGDVPYVRETEWQSAQSVLLWVDDGQAMSYSGSKDRMPKGDRAQLLALALTVLLLRGGERVGLLGGEVPARSGKAQLDRIYAALLDKADTAPDHAPPVTEAMPPHAKAVLLSDFLGDLEPVRAAIARAADQGITGVLLQVLDPDEESFPFEGRTIFESMAGALRHETLRAGDLRHRYLARLAARKDELSDLARHAGWQYHCHHTEQPAQSALLWLYRALERRR